MDSLVSIIIPHWNGIDVLSECLDSLKKTVYPNFEIIVVDNASTCLLYTSPSPRDRQKSRMPSSA